MALWEMGFSRTQSDGELLAEILELEKDPLDPLHSYFGQRVLSKACECQSILEGSFDENTIRKSLTSLISKVRAGLHSSKYNHLQTQWAIEDRAQDLTQFQPSQDLENLAKRWRHWKPRSGNPTPAATQRLMDTTLRGPWR